MAQITTKPKVDLELFFKIDESEARALDALTGYGFDTFLKVFKENLGKAYMTGNEEGLRKFFGSVRQFIPGYLEQLSRARNTFNNYDK